MQRTLLLVDDETNILSTLARLFRRDGYNILTANSGYEGLKLLENHDVGVIISDQRMPEMSGIEFLNQVKQVRPNSVRIVLSGYTDLKTVTDAINEGAIYKFLTKPWEDDLLRENVRVAFEHYELEQENAWLASELKCANDKLEEINQELERRVELKTREIMINVRNLQIYRDIVENIPLPVIGFSTYGKIAFANRSACEILGESEKLAGRDIAEVMPADFQKCFAQSRDPRQAASSLVLDNGQAYMMLLNDFEIEASVSGWVMSLINTNSKYGLASND